MSDLFQPPDGYAPRSAWQRGCSACGACCSAPDIAALGKPLGVPCVHLGAGCLCRIYEGRPAVCRNYQPDWVCGEVAPLPTLQARIERFLDIYGLLEPEPSESPDHG
ncbi:YkgJ family cysteine cluster protein [Deinococcus ruber]|uniref:Zinc/iron-chelating domain-containing protein n=1 Tax=Deinococcus ruber TaxID=1848197 RepID=A0A918EZ57_9DEIO|nr:YkgJ family cysteine cluster protein [Deinococcus ruber]GGQ92856.1 zinc/iron-chelating domain-containing protein [Deinococcus ruber]